MLVEYPLFPTEEKPNAGVKLAFPDEEKPNVSFVASRFVGIAYLM